ncbi:MAG: RsmE family RNA methyltransferase [Pirellulaceae bacterium]|nr:16S rRNA (uracil(1498)-N(3))-methyltransferase [Planctomycetales bacterium]
MLSRFYCETAIEGSTARLDGSEAHHLLHVLRGQVGDEVLLFDGHGAEFTARIENCARSEVMLQVLARHDVDRELSIILTLGVSLPKGERQRWMVEKCVELGVHSLVPLVTKRSVAQPTGKALDRLRRAVIEASKQCGRNRLMAISEPQHWHSWCRTSCTADAYVAHPYPCENTPTVTLDELHLRYARSSAMISMAVGPEGGLTDDEIEQVTAGEGQLLSLGPRILRVETAAIVIAAWGSSIG